MCTRSSPAYGVAVLPTQAAAAAAEVLPLVLLTWCLDKHSRQLQSATLAVLVPLARSSQPRGVSTQHLAQGQPLLLFGLHSLPVVAEVPTQMEAAAVAGLLTEQAATAAPAAMEAAVVGEVMVGQYLPVQAVGVV